MVDDVSCWFTAETVGMVLTMVTDSRDRFSNGAIGCGVQRGLSSSRFNPLSSIINLFVIEFVCA